MALEIIYEDKDIAVMNKPAGIAVHPAPHNPEEKTLVPDILERWPEIKDVGEDALRPGIVHRLDKETSGVLVVAKNQSAFEHLKEQFQSRAVKKTYLALVIGRMPQKEGEISYAIGRSKKFGKFAVHNTRKSDFRGKADFPKLREAITRWRVLEDYEDENGNPLTLLEIKPATGRTHQIRVHLASIGHPVAGDNLYGGKPAKKYRDVLERQFLHASTIELTLPKGGKLRVEAELPDGLSEFLRALKKEV